MGSSVAPWLIDYKIKAQCKKLCFCYGKLLSRLSYPAEAGATRVASASAELLYIFPT
jgi:hypothetical protein